MNNNEIFILLQDYNKPGTINTYGIQIARKLKMPATFIGLIQTPVQTISIGTPGPGIAYNPALYLEKLKRLAEEQMEKYCRQVQNIWSKVSYELVQGDAENQTIILAKERKPYLMLLESKSELNPMNVWFGTMETHIAEKSPCPVLVMPNDKLWREPKKLLHIMDMGDAKLENLRILTNLAANLEAHLQVVLISDKNITEADGNYQKMIDLFDNVLEFKNITFHRMFGDKSGEEIVNLSNALKPDWLAIEHKNRTFIERLFDDYNTKQFILQSEIPVLVL